MLVLCLLALLVELEQPRVSLDRDESHSMGEVLIWDDRCILPHVDFLNGHRGDLSYHYPPQRVCHWWLYANEVEHDFFVGEGEDLYVAVVDEALERHLV